jgi:hypothetical protein
MYPMDWIHCCAKVIIERLSNFFLEDLRAYCGEALTVKYPQSPALRYTTELVVLFCRRRDQRKGADLR